MITSLKLPSSSTEDARITAEWADFMTEAQQQRFVDEVSCHLRSLGCDFECRQGAVLLRTKARRKPQQLGLLNLAQHCARMEASSWPALISAHFERLFASRSEDEALRRDSADFEKVRHSLKVRIFPSENLELPLRDRLVWRQAAPGMSAVLVFDLPSAARTVIREEARQWQRTDEALFEIGLANVRAQDPVRRQQLTLSDEAGVSVTALAGDTFFTSSHALFLDEYLPPGSDGAVVAIPNRQVVLFYPLIDLKVVGAINAMIPLAQRMFRNGPGSICPDLYWFKHGQLTLLPSRLEGRTLSFEPPEEFVEALGRLFAHWERFALQ